MAELVPHKHEQLAMGAVILGGIAALVFGFSYVGSRIENPLRLKPKTYQTPYEQELAAQSELRTKDTDQDGLVDYDEIYVWRTSAYLADSDSDGFGDKMEVESGNDPNCPAGRDCARITADATAETETDPLGLIPPNVQDQIFGASGDDLDNLSSVLSALDAGQIRTLLIQNGVPQERLDELDDASLLELYQQSIAEAMAQVRAQQEGTSPEE